MLLLKIKRPVVVTILVKMTGKGGRLRQSKSMLTCMCVGWIMKRKRKMLDTGDDSTQEK